VRLLYRLIFLMAIFTYSLSICWLDDCLISRPSICADVGYVLVKIFLTLPRKVLIRISGGITTDGAEA